MDAKTALAILAGAIGPLAGITAFVYRHFRRSGIQQVESFSRYVSQGIKYYLGRFVRRQLAAEFTLRQYARLHLRNTATHMLVPATYPVRLAVDAVFVPLLLRDSMQGTIDYHRLAESSSARSMIVGEPGSGKSSLMKRSFRDACRRAAADPRGSPLPILFELRDLSALPDRRLDLSDPEIFLDVVSRSLADAAVFKADKPLQHLQHGPGLLILLDGLDEVPTELVDIVTDAIAGVADYLGNASPGSSVVVSTRSQHWLTLQSRRLAEKFEVLELRSFTISDIYQFLLRWPFDQPRRETVTRIFSRIRQFPSLTEMCANPLALAMFVARDQQTAGAQLPDTRTEFYASLVDELLVNRRLRREEAAFGRQRLREARENVLGRACLGHLLDPDESPNSIPVARMLEAIEATGYGDGDARASLDELAVDTGLSRRSGGERRSVSCISPCASTSPHARSSTQAAPAGNGSARS